MIIGLFAFEQKDSFVSYNFYNYHYNLWSR